MRIRTYLTLLTLTITGAGEAEAAAAAQAQARFAFNQKVNAHPLVQAADRAVVEASNYMRAVLAYEGANEAMLLRAQQLLSQAEQNALRMRAWVEAFFQAQEQEGNLSNIMRNQLHARIQAQREAVANNTPDQNSAGHMNSLR